MAEKNEELEKIKTEIANCKKCSLWKYRKNPVPGEGNISAEVMFIGEAPGKSEDEQGRPFVGAAGKLLTQLINSIELSREEVYITNVLKCRPPNNRDPLLIEIEACTPYLNRQIAIIKPKIIMTLGNHSTKYILKKLKIQFRGITRARGKIYSGTISGVIVKVIPTFHPAAALYNPRFKRYLEEDFMTLKKLLEGKIKQRGLFDFIKSF